MMLHNKAFAWDNDEQGHFCEDFFPPIDIPVVPHEPWVGNVTIFTIQYTFLSSFPSFS